jgi:hypothetical protein
VSPTLGESGGSAVPEFIQDILISPYFYLPGYRYKFTPEYHRSKKKKRGNSMESKSLTNVPLNYSLTVDKTVLSDL